MLFYAEHTNPRLQYILDFISTELFTQPFSITTNITEFRNSREPKINYSTSPPADDEFHICPVPLLFEDTITAQPITCFEVGKQKAFFRSEGRDFPFDI